MTQGNRNARPGAAAGAAPVEVKELDPARAMVGSSAETTTGETAGDEVDWKAKYEALKADADARAAAEKKRRLNVRKLGVALVSPVDPDDNGQQRTTALRNSIVALINDLLPADDE